MLTLDEKDKQILEVLKEHADYPTRKIAKLTLLPITTVHNRIRKLKEKKVIKRFTVELDHGKVEKGFLVYVLVQVSLPLLKQKKKSQYDIAKEIKKFYFVERVDIITGGADLIAIVRVKDVEEYDQVLLKKLQLVEGVEKTQSLVVIHGEWVISCENT